VPEVACSRADVIHSANCQVWINKVQFFLDEGRAILRSLSLDDARRGLARPRIGSREQFEKVFPCEP
jgi:hypothetical protein